MVKKIATEEGWELDPYEDPGKEGGINIGNAILFSQQSPEKFRKIGIRDSIIKKIETLGWFGVKGKEAAEILARTKDSHNVTESEVNEIANKVTDAGMNDLRKLIPDLDAAYTFGQQALVGSMYHQYGKKLFGYDAWKQFKNKDWPALVNNLITWSEKKGDTEESIRVAKSIEGRRARESKWIDEE